MAYEPTPSQVTLCISAYHCIAERKAQNVHCPLSSGYCTGPQTRRNSVVGAAGLLGERFQ